MVLGMALGYVRLVVIFEVFEVQQEADSFFIAVGFFLFN